MRAQVRHLRILEYVDALARTGSVRGAAEQLNFTASALTRRIQDLEEELGATLFERTPRGMRPTAAGELFVSYARAQLAEGERLRSGLEDLKGLRRGRVRIACSQAVAHEFLPMAISSFRDGYPEVDFEVRVSSHEQAAAALSAYDVDIALVFSPAPLPEFETLATLTQRLVALVPRGHPLAAKKTLRLRDCAAYPLALPDRSTGGRALLDAFSQDTGIAFDVVVDCNSFELLRRAVVRSHLVSFQIEIGAPGPDTEPEIAVRAIDRRDAPAADLVLGQLKGRSLPVMSAVFVQHLVDGMARLQKGRQAYPRPGS